MLHKLAWLQALVDRYASFLGSIPLLVTRITVGLGFFATGRGKIAHIDGVIEYFTSLGIPLAKYQAPFVAHLEYYGGILLMIGLFCRPIAFMLACTMVVAIKTADWDSLKSAWDLTSNSFPPVSVTSYTYLVLLGFLACYGAGLFSLDRIGSFLLQKRAHQED